MQFTLNNHLKYNIGASEYGFRTNAYQPFSVRLGQVDKDHFRKSSFKSELLRIADNVLSQLGSELIVFFSGGTDSEIVIRNFIDIGFKPTCAIIRLENDYNALDVQRAVLTAEQLGVKLHIIDFKIKDFLLSGEAIAFGEEVQCAQITYLMVYSCILKMGMPAVMGGEVMFVNNYGLWNYTFRENEDASAMRFSNKYNVPLVYEWFTYTPEILLHYMEDPVISNLLNNKIAHKLSSVSTKNSVLQLLYPSVNHLPKSHGFEKLLGFNFEAYKAIAANQIKRLEPSLDGIPVNLALQMLRGEA